MPEAGNPDLIELSDLDALALLFFSLLTFFQQVGFASLEAGSVRAKNVRNILLKTLADKLIAGIIYFLVGFAFAYGDDWHGFIGKSYFGLAHTNRNVNILWFFSYVFLITSTTIVSGCLAERANFVAYLAYTPIMAGVVYPLASHWAGNGWLATSVTPCRFLDFAGGATVHLIGGVGGLVATLIIEPRRGRFSNNGNGAGRPIQGHNITLVATGTLMLWFGWFAFNAAPSFLRGDNRIDVAARVLVNTAISACFGGATGFTVWAFSHGFGTTEAAVFDLRVTCDSIISGIVGITSIAPHLEPWGSALIGVLSALVYLSWSWAVRRAKVDDPLDSTAIHAGASLVGIIGTGFLAKPNYIQEVRGSQRVCGGVFYTGLGWQQLAVQIVGALTLAALSALCSALTFGLLKWVDWLRITVNEEAMGLDNVDHGGLAYPDFAFRRVPELGMASPACAPSRVGSSAGLTEATTAQRSSMSPSGSDQLAGFWPCDSMRGTGDKFVLLGDPLRVPGSPAGDDPGDGEEAGRQRFGLGRGFPGTGRPWRGPAGEGDVSVPTRVEGFVPRNNWAGNSSTEAHAVEMGWFREGAAVTQTDPGRQTSARNEFPESMGEVAVTGFPPSTTAYAVHADIANTRKCYSPSSLMQV